MFVFVPDIHAPRGPWKMYISDPAFRKFIKLILKHSKYFYVFVTLLMHFKEKNCFRTTWHQDEKKKTATTATAWRQNGASSKQLEQTNSSQLGNNVSKYSLFFSLHHICPNPQDSQLITVAPLSQHFFSHRQMHSFLVTSKMFCFYFHRIISHS